MMRFPTTKSTIMDNPNDFLTAADQIIRAGQWIDSKGWVPATSGNFSIRLPDGTIAITVSGRHKGHLQVDDIMRVDSQGQSLDGKQPSAETLLHTALYQRYPNTKAILHPHMLSATLISRLCKTEVVLEGYELLKALAGINTHDTRITLPIFANDQDIPRLAKQVDAYLDQHGDIYGYIIASHGLYTWGRSMAEALRHLEALDFLLTCELHLRGIKP
jgi:methylthioribulose-1-phosphate dehydratase